jgi:glycosidase
MDDRRDFPGGFPGDSRDAFTAAGRTPEEQPLFAAYRELLQLRKATPALRRGTLTDLVAHENIYVYLRQYQAERVVVALNLGKAPAEAPLPSGLSGPAERLYGTARWIDAPGGPRLELPAESVSIVRLKGH